MDKFDIHKWQRDAYSILNEANSEAAFEVYKTITNSKKYNSLEYDERKYVADKLYQDLFLTPPNDIKDVTTEEVNPHFKIEKELKGIFADKSTGVFNGKVVVEKEAQKTNAFQANNNILLSDKILNSGLKNC